MSGFFGRPQQCEITRFFFDVAGLSDSRENMQNRLDIDHLLNSAAPYNPREIDAEAAEGLSASIDEFGDIAGLTYNARTGRMVAGHQRVRALHAAGAQIVYEGDVPVVRVGRDGERFPVRVVDWDESKEKAANIAANNQHIAGRFTEALQPMLSETYAAMGAEKYSALRFDALQETVADGPAEDDIDEEPEPPADPVTKAGDVWLLGDHRLVCGDAMEFLAGANQFSAFVTSPPYNQIKPTKPSGMYSKVPLKLSAGYRTYADDMPEPEYQHWMKQLFDSMRKACVGTVWVNHKVRYRDGFGIHPLQFLGFDQLWCEIIWRRNGGVAHNAKRFVPCHESIFGHGRPASWNDSEKHAFTVWDIASEKSSAHACPYPLEIPARLIRATTARGSLVGDPFMGSGTTLIACEKTERIGAGSEIDPGYCDVIVERWQNLTGGKARRATS